MPWKRLVINKRESKEYQSVTGYLPKKLVQRFKAAIAFQDIDQSGALEEAVKDWTEKVEARQRAES